MRRKKLVLLPASVIFSVVSISGVLVELNKNEVKQNIKPYIFYMIVGSACVIAGLAVVIKRKQNIMKRKKM